MKIAIFHNYFDNVGGGEKLVVEMARMLHADIITTDVRKEVIAALGAQDVRFISLGKTIKLPGLKQISASWLFAKADLRGEYDFFILSGDWVVFAAKKHHPNLLYCHTPPRAFYDLYASFLRKQLGAKKIVFRVWVSLHKRVLEHYLRFVQKIVCNSETTRQRIQMFWKRDAAVIYPFSAFSTQARMTHFDDFWLSVNRLYPEKRIELQVEALRRLPKEKLVIVGGVALGDHAEAFARRIRKNLPLNVMLLQHVPVKELARLYSTCKGLLATARDEDFGMNIIEAFSFGKPVVAVNEGGYAESMINGKTGFLVDADVTAIVNGINIVKKNPMKFQGACFRRAQMFTKEKFERALRKHIGVRVKSGGKGRQ